MSIAPAHPQGTTPNSSAAPSASLGTNVKRTGHSFVFAVIPALMFWTANVKQLPVPLADAARTGLALLTLNLLLLVVLARFRGPRAAAVTLSTFWLALSLYLAARSAIRIPGLSEFAWAASWVAVTCATAWWVGRPRPNDGRYVSLNVAALAAAGACAATAGAASMSIAQIRWQDAAMEIARQGPKPAGMPSPIPNIYYVVLDGLGRPDVLRNVYGLELERELAELRRLGWAFAAASRTNYTQTYFSLASALSGAYLEPLADVMEDRRDRRAAWEVLQRSTPIAALKAYGYVFEMIGSNTSVTTRHRQADRCRCRWPGLNEFENGLLAITPFRALPLYGPTYGAQYEILHSAFEALEAPAPDDRPRIVFAHIMAPHPPFVVDAEGRRVDRRGPVVFPDADHYPGTREEYRHGYSQQARWVVGRVAAFAQHLAARDPQAIVVVHGDHGPGATYSHYSGKAIGLAERLPIFMAMRLGEGHAIPDDLSPVNVLRVIFNARFGSSQDLLPNRSFYSTWLRPYKFEDVEHRHRDGRQDD